jgi:hypothetical protein
MFPKRGAVIGNLQLSLPVQFSDSEADSAISLRSSIIEFNSDVGNHHRRLIRARAGRTKAAASPSSPAAVGGWQCGDMDEF